MDQALPAAGRAGMADDRIAEASTSAVAWPAILGGAFAAAALYLALLALGSGFGLAAVSPWPNSGASATTFTVTAAIWLVIVQWFTSGVGGYLTGRLRTKWAGLHTHEVFFRDTANGFLSWAVGAVVMAAFLASAASSIVGGITQAATGVAAGAAQGASQAAIQSPGGMANASGYWVDSLYRSDRPSSPTTNQDSSAEAGRILMMGMRNGDVPAADKTHLAQLVSARTGLSQADAAKRVDDVIAQEKAAEAKARAAVDSARKTAASLSIYTGLAMLIGAFIACAAAALGGEQRDRHA